MNRNFYPFGKILLRDAQGGAKLYRHIVGINNVVLVLIYSNQFDFYFFFV